MSAPQTLDGKIVLKAYFLDNSYKTLLVEPSSTVHDVCRRCECAARVLLAGLWPCAGAALHLPAALCASTPVLPVRSRLPPSLAPSLRACPQQWLR